MMAQENFPFILVLVASTGASQVLDADKTATTATTGTTNAYGL
jgi:hypothetical protein